jgi:hypothetical protein
VQLERLGQLKNAMTSSEIEPATFWLVACMYVLWDVDVRGSAPRIAVTNICLCYNVITSREAKWRASLKSVGVVAPKRAIPGAGCRGP